MVELPDADNHQTPIPQYQPARHCMMYSVVDNLVGGIERYYPHAQTLSTMEQGLASVSTNLLNGVSPIQCNGESHKSK